jgi:predicted nucleotidyltransferase
VKRVTALAEASLTDAERRALDRAVSELERAFGERLRAVWLYGSRARGERPHPESDVDLLVVLDHRTWADDWDAIGLVMDAAEAEGLNRLLFSARTYGLRELAQRREINSFFIQEVDRDKIVLLGEP